MKLPAEVRERFRRHGRDGGRARAAKLPAEARRAAARRAATARWIRDRFGVSRFEELGLPGGEIVDAGLADLAEGRRSIESFVVSLAAPRLRREGVPVGPVHDDRDRALYERLSETEGELAHSRYLAYRRRIESFANACVAVRLAGKRRAR